MPLLAKLLLGLLAPIFNLVVSAIGIRAAIRLTAVGSLAALYLVTVTAFTTMIAPWLSSVFNTAYGQFLGLLFPPVAGTVLASLSAYWVLVAGQKYVARLTKMAVG
jgi:ABC-type transport system involved in cytochrome bd biosynthesis fused ATPase/permease subunit